LVHCHPTLTLLPPQSSSECDTSDGTTCESDGSTNYFDHTKLDFDLSTGKFSGTVVTNECNDQLRQYGFATASCEQQTIPAPSATNPGPTPVLGRIAMTLSGGVNIYSAFEAGFNDCAVDGMPCACDGASCPGGMDVKTCEEHLYHACTTDVAYQMFMDSCGGHATPYHIHTDPVCNYEEDSDTGHSTLVGVSLDGYGIYGKFETHEQRPCDLDVCHGHVGKIPVQEEYGITKSVDAYHYHVQDTDIYPYTWTLSCYGDPDTPMDLDTCKSLYDDCDDDMYTVETADGTFEVDLYCPCFDVVQEGCDAIAEA
jgi:hypothetical protein